MSKTFPIQANSGKQPYPLTIPWSVAELAYSAYAGKYGTRQSLERLAERGGFGAGEMDRLLPDWRERVNEVTALRARIAKLESYLDKSADGVLLVEADHLYCPHCGDEVKQDTTACYCWTCPNPDSFNDIPLPLSYGLCLAVKPSQAAKPI